MLGKSVSLVPDVFAPPYSRSIRPCLVGALGAYWGVVSGIDGMGFDSEEVLGVWGGLFGAGAVFGVVSAGYSGIHSDR